MKVAVLGGTGRMGGALARHLARNNQVIIGSRSAEKAKAAAALVHDGLGGTYLEACGQADVALFSLPYSAIGEAEGLRGALAGKLVLSLMNPMKLKDGILVYGLKEGSATEKLAEILDRSRVATAFNNIPVGALKGDEVPPMDILVAAQSKEAYEEAAEVVRSVPNLRPLYAGPLSEAQVVERITPLVLNLAKWNGTASLGTKFVDS